MGVDSSFVGQTWLTVAGSSYTPQPSFLYTFMPRGLKDDTPSPPLTPLSEKLENLCTVNLYLK